MKIPQIRERLHELADLHSIEELHELALELRRRPSVRRARKVSPKMTPELTTAVEAYAAAFPEMSLHEIGQMFRINHGRVSETLRGKRT